MFEGICKFRLVFLFYGYFINKDLFPTWKAWIIQLSFLKRTLNIDFWISSIIWRLKFNDTDSLRFYYREGALFTMECPFKVIMWFRLLKDISLWSGTTHKPSLTHIFVRSNKTLILLHDLSVIFVIFRHRWNIILVASIYTLDNSWCSLLKWVGDTRSQLTKWPCYFFAYIASLYMRWFLHNLWIDIAGDITEVVEFIMRAYVIFFNFINELCYSYRWSIDPNLLTFSWHLRSKVSIVKQFLVAKFMNCLLLYGFVKGVHVLVPRAVGYLLNSAGIFYYSLFVVYLIISGSPVFKCSSLICAILGSTVFT